MKTRIAILYVIVTVLAFGLLIALKGVFELRSIVILQQNNTDALIGIMKLQAQNTDTLMHTVGSQSLQPSR